MDFNGEGIKLAIVGSRSLCIVDIAPYITGAVDTIISGGARGIDRIAADYATKRSLNLIEILPDYKRYGRGAPYRRNEEIIAAADKVIAFWDGKSTGTRYVINRCHGMGKECQVIYC